MAVSVSSAAACALLLAAPAAGFAPAGRRLLSHTRRSQSPAPLRASMEVVDALSAMGHHGLDGVAAHAALALDALSLDHAPWLDASSSLVADAAALPLPNDAAVASVDAAGAAKEVAASAAGGLTDARSAGAIADEKALAEGGIHPWRAWRGFIQNSIVGTNDLLSNTFGMKENSFGFAIILFTIGLRLAVSPLTWVQYSSTEKMKAMNPYMLQIKERYANDPQMQNIMTAKLYEDTNSNPLLGCLPAFLQIPVFIALYRSILNLANDKLLEEPFLFIPTLEGPTLTDKLQLPQGRGLGWLSENWVGDGSMPTFLGGQAEPLLGWHDTAAYVALPIIITLTQYFTQSLITPPIDESLPQEEQDKLRRTQGILKYIPLSLGFFSLQVPAALCLYWFTSNIMSAASTTAIRKYFELNPPQVDWDFLEQSAPKTVGGSAFQLQMPANMDEAIADARLNARPPRVSRIASGINAVNAEVVSSSGSAAAPTLAVEDILATD